MAVEMTQFLAASVKREGGGCWRGGVSRLYCKGGCVNTFVALFDEFYALLYMMAGNGKRKKGWG